MIQKEKTPKQIAEITGYKENTIQRACREGQIKARKVGTRWLVDVQSALEFGKQKPHAEHTRKRQEKLEEAHGGGLDLPEPEEQMNLFDQEQYTPELVIDDEMDPAIKALLSTAYELIGTAMELVMKAGKRAAEIDMDITTEVQA